MSDARNPDSSPEHALLGAVVDDFLERQQRGEQPQIEDYARRHPELAVVLRQLLPTLALLRWSTANHAAPSPAVPEEFHVGGALGDYRIVREVGRGGMGVVYEAEQVSLGRRVALKVLPFAAALDARQLQRFKNEAQAAAQLHHTNIVPVFAVGSDRGVHYYAMQFIEGQSLATLIAELRRLAGREPGDPGGGPAGTSDLAQELISGRWAPPRPRPAQGLEAATAPAPGLRAADTSRQQATVLSEKSESRRPQFLRTVARLGAQAAVALEQAHSLGVIHRDIKPANLLVDLRGNLWVTDFGLARLAGDGKLTLSGDLLGTLRYMSPEQALAKHVLLDHRTDVYSLGSTLYELATLEPTFGGRDREELLRQITFDEPLAPRRRNPAIPRELETVILKAMAKNPAERYDTAGELADDLQRFLRDEPIRAKRPTLMRQVRRWSRRHWEVLTTALVALGILLVSCTLISAVAAFWLREERNLARHQEELANERAEEIRLGLERLKAANGLLDRGRQYVAWGQWDDAHSALTKAIQIRPDLVPLWVERCDLYTRLGLWEEAAVDFARELELQEPEIALRWYRHALLRLQVGDVDGYRHACQRVRQRFGQTVHVHFAMEMVRTCMLGPDPEGDLALLADRAQQVVESNPGSPWWDLYIVGCARYRAGEYAQAIRWLSRSLTTEPDSVARAMNYPLLAMAHHRLGQAAEARQALAEMARAMEERTRERYEVQGLDWVRQQGAVAAWRIPWWDWLEGQHYYREASVLLTGSLPPDDPRETVLRARSFAGLRWSTRAGTEYARAQEQRPGDPQIRMEAHRNRAHCWIALRQWSLAAAECAQASALQPDDVVLRQRQAATQFRAGEVVAYRQTCADMLERFGKTKAPFEAGCVLWACLLREDALSDMTRLLPLRSVAAGWHFGGAQMIGAAHYRTGRYDEAVRSFERIRASFGLRTWDWSFLAMAHHRLGHVAEARRCLAESARWIAEADRQEENALSGDRPVWQGWPDRIVGPLLLLEAERLINGSPAGKAAD